MGSESCQGWTQSASFAQWGIAEAALLCSVDNQSVDRAYRIGQPADVVVRLIEPDRAILRKHRHLMFHRLHKPVRQERSHVVQSLSTQKQCALQVPEAVHGQGLALAA